MRDRTLRIQKTATVCVTAALALALASSAGGQGPPPFDNRWHVDESVAGPPNDGLTWATAFRHLQDALDAAADPLQSDEIWVAVGTYNPDRDMFNPNGSGDRSASFELQENVSIFGGFLGGETNLSQRDPETNITVLSGQLGAPCGDPGDCTIAHGAPGCDDADCCETVCAAIPSCCDLMMTWDQSCADLVNNNLVCANCGAANPSAGPCSQANPGTVGCDDAACCSVVCLQLPFCCTIEWDANCAFAASQDCPPPPRGVYHVVTADSVDESAVLDGFTITAGSADGPGIDSDGAGILIVDASPLIARCRVTGNVAVDEGGGAHVMGAADATLVNCSFIANDAREGGGLHVESGSPKATLVNCLFDANTATDHAGAIDAGGEVGGAAVEVVDCTLTANSVSAGSGGAIWIEGVSLVTITNSILWGNTPDQIQVIENGSAVASFSDFEGGIPPGVSDGGGNIAFDPRFVGVGDSRLLICSPCIDEADNNGLLPDSADLDADGDTAEPTPRDLDLNSRIQDGDQDASATEILDIGAYEFVPPLCPWDCQASGADGAVGILDWLDVLAQWGQQCTSCDFGVGALGVGINEFLRISAHWGVCPMSSAPEPLTLEEELEEACLTMDDWDKHVDTMTDPDVPQAEKDNSDCWMRHYINDCTRCICFHPPNLCPGPDPFKGP